MKNNCYAVILAGGKGERLWPLSRSKKPKQLLPFALDTTLLDQAIDRVAAVICQENIIIITTADLQDAIHQKVGHKVGSILIEPVARNTAPAIALAAATIYAEDPEATLLFLSADHYIPEPEIFVNALKKCAAFATATKGIVLVGLRPTSAATGYGYIEYENDDQEIHKVIRFHEKPSLDLAQEYIKKSTMLWNIGLFCARADIFIESFKKYAPAILQCITAYINGDQNAYAKAQKISIDHAILEKSNEVFVLPSSFVWSDVGDLETFLSLAAADGSTDIITIDAHNNLVLSELPVVALIGVSDLCVVQTADVLLIVKRTDVQRVKDLVQLLQKKGGDAYL